MASKKEIKYSIDKEKAIKIAKKAASGKFAILKDNGASFKAGSPGMTALVEVEDGVIYVSGGWLGGPIANTIYTEICNAIDEANESSNSTNASNQSSVNKQDLNIDTQLKVAEALIKFKQLFDSGIITEEEFNNKKKELLGQTNSQQSNASNQQQINEETINNKVLDTEQLDEPIIHQKEVIIENSFNNGFPDKIFDEEETLDNKLEVTDKKNETRELTPEEKRKKIIKRFGIISAVALITIGLITVLILMLAPIRKVKKGDFVFNRVDEGYSVSSYCGDKGNTNVVIPDKIRGVSVTSIGNHAFYDCTSLTSITIPNSVTSIGDGAFFACTNLTSITIPDSVTSIGDGAFIDCPIEEATIPAIACSYINNDKLKKVTITSGTSIGDGAFYNCTSLTSITIPDSVTSIGAWAFLNCPIEEATIPALACSYINNDKLKNVTVTSGTSIGEYAFHNCTSLTSITIPDSVTSIGNDAFNGCASLAGITISNGVTSIGAWAFLNCKFLTSIIIPDSVTSIGGSAFYNCTSLTIYCEAQSKPSGWSSNWNSSNCKVIWGYTGE